jgi:3-polyprenyl-4-hydroxybenzoate decarboxylase
MNERRKELEDIFKDVDENQRRLVERLLDECVFLEERMAELKKLPFIRVHPSDPSRQITTPAAKQYKETTQSYMNCVRILCSLLHKVDGIEDDPVQKFLEGLNDVR